MAQPNGLPANAPVDPGKPVDQQPSDTGLGQRDFDLTAVNVLLKRVLNAKQQGAKNVAIDVDFLSELLHGCGQAMTKADWVSNHKI